MKKRILAVLMALVMTIGMFPEKSLANETDNVITSENGQETVQRTNEIKATPDLKVGAAVEAGADSNPDYSYGTGLAQPRGEEFQLTGKDADTNGIVESTGTRASDSYWDKFESNYYYDQLTNDEKAFYNNLDAVCYKYLTSTDDITESKSPYTGLWYSDAVDYGNLDYYNVKNSQVQKVFMIFKYSNPQYYFIGWDWAKVWEKSKPYFVFQIYHSFLSGDMRSYFTNNFKSTVNNMVDKIQTQSSKQDQEKMAHDLIINKVNYDRNYIAAQNRGSAFFNDWFPGYEENNYTQSCFSTFCGPRNVTVCAGYSLAFEMLCNAVGIDTITVLSSEHAFNMIRQSGSWYYVDCTWDDPVVPVGYASVLQYNYFNRNAFNILYILDQDSMHRERFYLTDFLPECNLDSGAYGNHSGTISAANGTATVPTISVDSTGTLTISNGESGAKFYYTMDGTNPSVSTTKCNRYWGAMEKATDLAGNSVANKNATISAGMIVKAIAASDTKNDSSVQINTHTVTFFSMGGTAVAPQSVISGSLATKPANPTRQGYTCLGWFQDSNCTIPWDFGVDTVTSDMNLYAKWGKTYKIKYNLNGGTQNKTNPSSYTPLTSTFSLKSPSRKGYSFGGWYKDSELQKKVKKVSLGTKGALSFYAKWNKVSVVQETIQNLKNKSGKKMTVSVKKNGGVAGYQIQYAVKSNMKSAKTVDIVKTSADITGLKKNKTYYVRARAYKLDSANNKVYGSWSDIESVNIKK